MTFAAHARLFDQPDPRRLDLRASLSDVRRDWLVRTHHQRSSVSVKAIVDVSASMQYGTTQSKLQIAADFLDALGYSAHRYGDSVSLLAFDHAFRDDLYVPPLTGRGVGLTMAAKISTCDVRQTRAGGTGGLVDCAERIGGTGGLVFIVSDFHWSLDSLPSVLNNLAGALVVPLVVWDAAEIEPPVQGHWLSVRDAESGRYKRVWLREKTRRRWQENVAQRRADLAAVFGARDSHPFYVEGSFEAESLSQYFMERVA